MSTYREICALAKELLDGSTVTKRRKAGEELSAKLCRPDVRHRLALEATPLESNLPRESRHKALSEMWRLIMGNALSAIQKIGRKHKLVKSDIFLLRKLLESCSDVYRDEEELSSNIFLPPDPYLPRKQIRSIFKYCMELLDNDAVLDVAEEEVLMCLMHICSRPEFVNQMKPFPDMMMVLEEVEQRILPSNDDTEYQVSANCITLAATLFYKLLKTATDESIGLHLMFPGCIHMVARWCAIVIKIASSGSQPVGTLLLAGLVCLIMSNPEHAIQPLTRHGRAILKYVKKEYSITIQHAQTVMNDYLTSHM
jgi:hypothetical protein